MSNLQAVTDASFEADVLESNSPVIVDFWAAWCAPCKALAPVFEDVASKYEGKVKFVKMDVDSNPATAAKFGVRGIPTMILFKEGQVVGTQSGFDSSSKANLMKLIDSQV